MQFILKVSARDYYQARFYETKVKTLTSLSSPNLRRHFCEIISVTCRTGKSTAYVPWLARLLACAARWDIIIMKALTKITVFWIAANIVRYWAKNCTGKYWTVQPVSNLCSKERMPLWRKRCGHLFLAVSSISFVFITVINYNVLKELPADPNYWSTRNTRGSWGVNCFAHCD